MKLRSPRRRDVAVEQRRLEEALLAAGRRRAIGHPGRAAFDHGLHARGGGAALPAQAQEGLVVGKAAAVAVDLVEIAFAGAEVHVLEDHVLEIDDARVALPLQALEHIEEMLVDEGPDIGARERLDEELARPARKDGK